MVLHSGKEHYSFSVLPLPSSSSSLFLTKPLLLMFLVSDSGDGKNRKKSLILSNKSLLSASASCRNTTTSLSSQSRRHACSATFLIPSSGSYNEHLCSATAANVNITTFSSSTEKKCAKDVLFNFTQLFGIPLARVDVILQKHKITNVSIKSIISAHLYYGKSAGQNKKSEEQATSTSATSTITLINNEKNQIEFNSRHNNLASNTDKVLHHHLIDSECGSLFKNRPKTNCWSVGDLIRKCLPINIFISASCTGATKDTNNNNGHHRTLSNNTYESNTNYIGRNSSVNQLRSNNHSRNKHQSSTSTDSSSAFITAPQSLPEAASPSQDNLKMKEEKQLEFILKSLVAGGVAGMCAKTAVAPLDRMKILLQAHSKHYSHLGVFSGLRGIVQKERFIALYKGNGAQMVRIFPYAATQFTSFEMYKKFLGEDSHIARFSAGSLAGVTAVALTYPLDTIRARLAFQVTGEHVYSGIYSCALHIFREEGGVRALYRGFIPTVCGMVPYAGLSFYCFESFKYLCMKYLPTYTCKSHSTNTGGLVLLLYAKLICGGVAGAAAQTVAYPLDVTRRRMQLAMMDEKTKKFGMGMFSTIKFIYQENGVIRGLYRGMSINYLRAIPMVAVSFSTYELVKQTLKLDTGLAIKTG